MSSRSISRLYFRVFCVVGEVVFFLFPISALASSGSVESVAPPQTGPYHAIVIGFVGGFVRHTNIHHGPVKLAQRLHRTATSDTYIQVFENRKRRAAYETILRVLDANHDGVLSAEEKNSAQIVLLGQSWGASAAVMLARELRRQEIPVRLTVQVDSVAKLWQNDSVIPENVLEAVNYFQPNGIVHGRKRITAADPLKTKILGNYLKDYKKTPVQCTDSSWADRFFTPGHAQSECDPHLWAQIEDLVKKSIAPPAEAAKTNSPIVPSTE